MTNTNKTKSKQIKSGQIDFICIVLIYNKYYKPYK